MQRVLVVEQVQVVEESHYSGRLALMEACRASAVGRENRVAINWTVADFVVVDQQLHLLFEFYCGCY